jgi:hypothetical protein
MSVVSIPDMNDDSLGIVRAIKPPKRTLIIPIIHVAAREVLRGSLSSEGMNPSDAKR